jgi:sRNA-binding regulator protein Hfq
MRRSSGNPVSVHLRDGQVLVGRITYHDRDLIKLERAEGPHLLLRKADILYIADRR